MKAKALWLRDEYNNEVEEIEKLGLSKEPESERFEEGEVYFNIDRILFFNLDSLGNIRLFLDGGDLNIKHDQNIWNKLIERYG